MFSCVIKINQNNIDTGLINRQEITQGGFLIDCAVKVNNSNARTYLINTTEEKLKIEIFIINIEPVINTSLRNSPTCVINLMISNNLIDRLKVKENL